MKIDPQTGKMDLGWEILIPPFNFDLADSGKRASHGWAFWTCYNSERATGKLEETASQKDRDYIASPSTGRKRRRRSRRARAR